MDPNACLAEIRRLLAIVVYPNRVDHDALLLFELVEQLDIWMTKGGFPPDDWRR